MRVLPTRRRQKNTIRKARFLNYIFPVLFELQYGDIRGNAGEAKCICGQRLQERRLPTPRCIINVSQQEVLSAAQTGDVTNK